MENSTADEHGLFMYRNRGCRCNICKNAMRRVNGKRVRINKQITVQPLIDKFGEPFVKRFEGSVPKWLAEGISHRAIDRICVGYGYHPYEVYGDLWFEDIWKQMEKEKQKCESGNRSTAGSRTPVKTAQH